MLDYGQVELYTLCRETNSRLDSFAKAVAEARQLDAALDFCRYLRFSGLIRLFKRNPQRFPLSVDGYILEGKVNDLEAEILRRFKTGDVRAGIDVAELERISYKLDLIAGRLALVSPKH